MKNFNAASFILIFILAACSFQPGASTPAPAMATVAPATSMPTDTPIPTLPPATETLTPVPPTATSTETPTSIPTVESLDAMVTTELLSCRYGPGAEYLYLVAFKQKTPLKLIGRTDGNNWVMVKNKNLCWVNTKYLDIKGDPQALKIVYPDGYKLPVTPYYTAPVVRNVARDSKDANKIKVEWDPIELRAGDEEDENMFIYIIEVWRCEGGKMIFDPLASNDPEVTFVDEAGCSAPSHGRVFFQDKHGFAGPSEIPWPKTP